MSHHTSRNYQNILHISGGIYSFFTILGAVLIGKDNILGVPLMIIGAVMTRITSEIEYRKQEQLLNEFTKKDRQ